MVNNNKLTMDKFRIIYDHEKVIDVIPNDNSITYSAENCVIATLQEGGHILRTIGIDCTKIDELENGLI
jgi:hypothetical protein